MTTETVSKPVAVEYVLMSAFGRLPWKVERRVRVCRHYRDGMHVRTTFSVSSTRYFASKSEAEARTPHQLIHHF